MGMRALQWVALHLELQDSWDTIALKDVQSFLQALNLYFTLSFDFRMRRDLCLALGLQRIQINKPSIELASHASLSSL